MLSQGLGIWLNQGLLFGLASVLVSLVLDVQPGGIHLAERPRWTWSSPIRSVFSPKHLRTTVLLTGLLVILVGLSQGLSTYQTAAFGSVGVTAFSASGEVRHAISHELTQVMSYRLNFVLSAALSAGLSFVLSYWFLLGLLQGIVHEQVEDQDRRVFNQGIHRSFRTSVILGILSGSIIGMIGILSIWLSYRLSQGPNYELSQGLNLWWLLTASGGLLTCAYSGGLAVLRHSVLRLLLWCTHTFPWQATPFLDDARACHLVRRVGGGYSFMHRLLLEYFATLATPLPEEAYAVAARSDLPSAIASALQIDTAQQEERASPSLPSRQTSLNEEKRVAALFAVIILLLALICNASIFSLVHRVQQSADATTTAANATANVYDATAQATFQVESTATAAAQATVQVKANATAEAVANASPIAYPLQNMSPILNDPLQENSKGYQWEVDDPSSGNCKFINRTYDINTHNLEQCFARSTDFRNFIYEVQMKIVKGDGGGIAFRADPTEDQYYYFAINQNGSYSIHWASIFGNNRAVLAQGSSSAIHQGLNQTNLVAAVVRGTFIEVYVNHERVAVVGSSTYTHGRIGVIVTGSQNPTEVIFQNAKVWRL